MVDIKNIQKLIDWAKKDKERSVKIEVVNKEERIFVYDFSIMNGMIISNDSECEHLEELLEKDSIKRMEEEYRILRKKLNK